MWLDEVKNDRVTHLVELILSGHKFQTSDFSGGDTSFALVPEEKKNTEKHSAQPVHQRNLRKGVRKVDKPNAQTVHQRKSAPT